MAIKINEEMYHKSPYIDYMLYLFKVTSEEIYPNPIEIPTEAWEDYIDILYTRSGQEIPEKVITNCLPIIDIPVSGNKIVLAFSGGKDSVAHAAYLKDKGFDATLFYVKNANRSYPHEYDVATKISGMLNQKLIVEPLRYSGKVSKAESPVKNHVILSLIIHYMINNGITKCACGTYLEDTLSTISTQFGLSDAYEFYLAFEKAIKSTFPNFHWICWFKSDVHALAYLVNYHPELIPEYQSCLLPDRYRKRVREANERKYHIELLPNRCGSCWKCAQEYLILHMFHYHTLSKEFIVNQIFQQFRKDLKKVTEGEQEDTGKPIQDIIENYITLKDVQRYLDKDNIEKDIDISVFE